MPACAWPTVGAFYRAKAGTIFDACGAVYVGGRVIVTAAHCVQNDGFQLEQACEDDDDCPDLSAEVGSAITLTCEDHALIPGRKVCRDIVHDDISNNPSYVRFGTAYPGLYDDDEVRKSVSIEYCRLANTEIEGDNPHPDDFAYCLLTEEPGIPPVPIIMPCEVDAEMGAGTEVVSVGFGRCVPLQENSVGYKRLATTTILSSMSSIQTSITLGGETWSTVGDTCENPGGGADETGADADGGGDVSPAPGDSGGGLFAQMSDGTWRLVGINETDAPSFTPAWQYVEWIVDDPNVAPEDIRPCHDANGDWTGGTSCGRSPNAPGTASGEWHTGRTVCLNTTATRTDLCGEGVQAGPEVAYGDPGSVGTDPSAPSLSAEAAQGCRNAPGGPSGWPLALGAVGLLLLHARRAMGGVR